MYVRPSFYLLRLVFGLLALALVSLTANAAGAAADKAAFQAFMGTVAGNNTSIAFGGGGKVLATTAASGAGWVSAGNFGVSAAATPALGMVLKGTAMVEAAPGVVVPVVGASSITGANLFAGLKAAATIGASLVGGPWGVAFLGAGAVLDWMTASGVRADPANPTQLQRNDHTVCSVAPCWAWTINTGSGAYAKSTVVYTLAGAIAAVSGVRVSASLYNGPATGSQSGNVITITNNIYNNDGSLYYAGDYSSHIGTSVAPAPSSWLPASMDDIAPYMQAVQPSPAVVQQLLGTGASLQTEPVTVTAPSTVAGPTTTTNNADGTKTVTQTTNNFSTAGNTITNVGPTTTTTVYNTDNSVKSTSTSTTTPGPNDQPPQTDCDKFPDDVACTKLGSPLPAERLPSSTQSVTLTPSIFTSSAACPADSVIPVHVGPFSSTATISYAKMCEATSTYVYPLVMLIGAAIAAFVFIGGLKS